MPAPAPIDHVGWSLHQALTSWKKAFNQAMAEEGCVWMAEARGALIQHIGPSGIAQQALVEASGLTKQAVQQHLDGLVADGVVERVADPGDARKKRVQLTPKGHDAARTAQKIKTALEAEIASVLGTDDFAVLVKSLSRIAAMAD